MSCPDLIRASIRKVVAAVIISRISAHVLQHIVEGFHIAEFGIDVIEVPFNGTGNPVADTFAHDDGAEAVGDGILYRGPNAGRRGRPRNHHRIHTAGVEIAVQIGAAKTTGLFLDDQQFVIPAFQTVIDLHRF